MSVVIETTLGDITVDLYLDRRPVTCLNFLKLCKMKYYNFNLFHTIRNGFIAQTGDPTGEGSAGESIWGILEGPEKRFFSAEKMPKIRHTDVGLLSMVCTRDMMVGSQFFFTLASDLDSLDGVHCVIGEVTEGHEVLRKLNDVICDETHRPYQDVRITHTVILEDPFNDPAGLRAPSRSPSPTVERLRGGRIAPDEDLDETQGKSVAEIQEIIDEKEAKARATILEIVGDLPDADIAPPENVLFVCKLNPVTCDEDLEIIFSRFGKIVSCEVIRDKKAGDSLQYAFIEFEDKKSCEDAYFKMDNVLIDDRRIHVDFSQSVSKIQWLGKGRGVRHINNDESKDKLNRNKPGRSESRERDRGKIYKREHYRNDNRDKYIERESSNYKNRSEKDLKNTRSRRDRSRSKVETSKDRSYKNQEHREKNYMPYEEKNSKSRNHYKEEDSTRWEHNKKSEKCSSKKNRDPSSKIENKNNINENKYKESREKRNTYELNDKKSKEKSISKHKNDKSESVKGKHQGESHKGSKKMNHDEPRTPSPVTEKKSLKNGDKVNEKIKKGGNKNKQVKKKRKVSTSSSSESDTSSESSTSDSSSSSSSSSDSDRKEKKYRRKRKYSSSSSSETTSSSSSESGTSSSSSDSEEDKKKRRKNVSKRQIKKSKNKS